MKKIDILGYVVIACIFIACGYMYYLREGFELKCIVSTVDGNKYCVREREKLQEAADLLATVTEKCKNLVKYLDKKFPDKENVRRLVNGFNPKKIMETLPTSGYTAYSENKGEKVAFCLNRTKGGEDNLIDEHTLTFVAIHELSHIATESIGHKSEFWDNFKFLLENAKEAGLHDPKDYKKSPQNYCGMTIHDNPYYDI
uniref:WLM domain-containing protein n=1 Tax=viral metagenome TaxID=1070528 RepID=A0A6C0ERZ4_9ZZZZ